MANIYGRQVVIPLVNQSGGGVVAGDVVIVDTANDGAFTTTTSGQSQKSVGIAQETIAAAATGRVLVSGYAALVNVPASVTRGHYVETHTVVKQATGNSTRRAGSFGQFLTGGTTPTAWLWGFPDNAGAAGETVATSAIWDAAGDLAVGSGADTAARLAIGNAGGALSRINGAVAWNSGTANPTGATGDRYWRTDLGLEIYYDGTRWLTTQLFTMIFNHPDVLNPATTDSVHGRATIWSTDYDLWLENFYASTFVLTTNDGTKYWTLTVYKLNAAGTETSVAAASTVSDTPSNYVLKKVAINALLGGGATYKSLYVKSGKVSTAGNLYVAGTHVTYRLVIT